MLNTKGYDNIPSTLSECTTFIARALPVRSVPTFMRGSKSLEEAWRGESPLTVSSYRQPSPACAFGASGDGFVSKIILSNAEARLELLSTEPCQLLFLKHNHSVPEPSTQLHVLPVLDREHQSPFLLLGKSRNVRLEGSNLYP
jgi:hypothetical protein